MVRYTLTDNTYVPTVLAVSIGMSCYIVRDYVFHAICPLSTIELGNILRKALYS